MRQQLLQPLPVVPALHRACAMVRLVALGAVIALCAPAVASAQMGSTTDILTGVVTGPDSIPLEGVEVQATSTETQITRHTTTNKKGRYTLVFPDGGGQYRVTVRMVGMAEQQFAMVRQADEDRLVRNVQLGPTGTTLPEVRVVARNRGGGRDRPTPGSTERNIGGEQAAHLPIDASDPNALATLAPGVVGTGATDSTDAAFSVGGQRPTANNVTLDGLSFGGASVPQDAVRNTRVITNSYDVARGQFTGGIVASATKGGSDIPAGSFTYNMRNDNLAWSEGSQSPFAQGTNQQQLSGGFGGPIVRDKLFVFAAGQGRWRTDPVQSLLGADPATLQRLGVNPDSVQRFLNLVDRYGVPTTPDENLTDRATNSASALVRFDWLLSERHTLTLRGDWRQNTQDPTRVNAYTVPSTGGTMDEDGGGVMAVLTSRFGDGMINELRAYGSVDHRTSDPFFVLPAGRVQVTSSLPDSLQGVTNLGFGGNPSLPQGSDTHSLEASDELSFLSPGASHRYKLGLFVNVSRFAQDVTTNRAGTFTFPSLDAFDDNEPSTYTRILAPVIHTGTATTPALYAGDSWRPSNTLQLVYGVRLEGSLYATPRIYNGAADTLFGLRTDRVPSDFNASPRLGFTWTPGGTGPGAGGPATTIVRGGFGEFRSPVPTGLLAGAQGATGVESAESQLVCVGSAVPIPDWTAYQEDPSSVPTTCADATDPEGAPAKPNVAAFDNGFEAPRAWRGSLGVTRRFLERYAFSIDGSYARGVSQSGFRDLNLNTTPQFTLADEGNRPVYVPASAIVPGTGAVDPNASRIDPAFGQVLDISSDLASESEQIVIGINGFTTRGLIFNLSYTWTRARDQNSFSCCSATQGFASATTAGNPNDREFATSDFERRHQFLLTLTYPISAAWEFTTIGRVTSGAPFTPLVGSDINGDGLRNDRAFVFNPATAPDTAIANGMNRLLASAPSNVRSCLESQMGTVASRNSCTGSWQPSMDLQVNFRPNVWGLDRRLMFSLSTVNLLAGVDQLVHGANDLHGWGEPTRPDPTLLAVTGFDPSTNRFLYTVNERFGTTSGAAAAYRVPFQIVLQAHLVIGPDQGTDRLRAIFGGRGGGAGGGGRGGAAGLDPAEIADRLESTLGNPPAEILALKDSLALTDAQVTALSALRDSVAATNKVVADSIHAMVERAGPNPDAARLFASLRPQLLAARTAAQKAREQAEKLLTSEQRAKLPARQRRQRPQ